MRAGREARLKGRTTAAFAGPVIVFGSILTDAEVEAFRALAVDYILTKPTHMDALLGVLHAISARAV